MKRYEIGQKFWDEKNCRMIEIMASNVTGYLCIMVSEDASGDTYEVEGYQWFKASELNNLKPIG